MKLSIKIIALVVISFLCTHGDFAYAVTSVGSPQVQGLELENDVEGAYQHQNIPNQEVLREGEPEFVENPVDPMPAPDSLTWDPIRYMVLPGALRQQKQMGWEQDLPSTDANELYFDRNLDITNDIREDLLNDLRVSLGAGDIDSALNMLREEYGPNVEIVKA